MTQPNIKCKQKNWPVSMVVVAPLCLYLSLFRMLPFATFRKLAIAIHSQFFKAFFYVEFVQIRGTKEWTHFLFILFQSQRFIGFRVLFFRHRSDYCCQWQKENKYAPNEQSTHRKSFFNGAGNTQNPNTLLLDCAEEITNSRISTVHTHRHWKMNHLRKRFE